MRHILSFLLICCVHTAAADVVDMPLIGLDGEKTSLSQYRGKWVVVNYWATWCPPCIAEMPELQSFHDDNAAERAVVIGMNTELIGKRQLEDFLDTYFITYPIYMAGPKQESELGMIPGLPTTFMVSPQGEVVARQVGPVTGEMLEQFIDKWEAQ